MRPGDLIGFSCECFRLVPGNSFKPNVHHLAPYSDRVYASELSFSFLEQVRVLIVKHIPSTAISMCLL